MYKVFPEWIKDPGAIGFLLLRLITGFALMFHGYPKLVHGFTWMLARYPGTHIPGYIQVLAPVAEFGGGLALILGLLTPLACLGLICDMGFAIFYVHLGRRDPFVAPMGTGTSYEHALVYLGVAVLFLLAGPGVHSLDYLFWGRANARTRGSRDRDRVAAWR